jgi:Holliday junction resolvase RusA-like endonuclease
MTLTKALLDVCNGLVWVDDAQVVRVRAVKYYASGNESSHAEVTISPVE